VYRGATVCISDQSADSYNANKVGDLPFLFGHYFPLLEKHQRNCFSDFWKRWLSMGYFGNAGIDAMIYGNDQITSCC
jgi:hypothetical protein